MEKYPVFYYRGGWLGMQESLSRYHFALSLVGRKLILDVGCGARKGPQLLAQSAARVVAFDLSHQAVSYAQRNFPAPNMEYLAMDAQSLAFQSESFDLVTAFEVVEHLPDPEAFLAEVYRVIKPQGVYIGSTPNREVVVDDDPTHIREFNLGEYQQLLCAHFPAVRILGHRPCKAIDFSGEKQEQTHGWLRSWAPGQLKALLPNGFKDWLIIQATRWRGTLPRQTVGVEDFEFTPERPEGARYMLAVCEKG